MSLSEHNGHILSLAMIALISSFLVLGAVKADLFTAFNCQNPQNTKFVSHDECHKPIASTRSQQFKILQRKSVSDLNGFSCAGYRTVEVSYCGAYDHNKHTGESSFNVPIIFSQLECLAMISSKTFTTDSTSFPLVMNSLNSIKFFTHGGVSYTGTNIHCTGQSLRLKNGEVNSNMMRQEHVIIEIRRYQLIEVDGIVIDPITQVKLAEIQRGFAKDGLKTFIWTNTKKRCQLLQIMEINLNSNNGIDWVSHEHKIKISTVDTFHHTGCNIKITKTNANNIFLADPSQNNDMIQQIDAPNVDLSVELQTRFSFIYGEMTKLLNQDYKELDPVCHMLHNFDIADTQRIGNNRFIKTLGDISVTFDCMETQVAPNPSELCHSMAAVTDINGGKWFLNPVNRILMTQAITVPCVAASLPVYRNKDNQMITFNPSKTIINNVQSKHLAPNSTNENTGLYPQDLVRNWLKFSFLQHWNKFSYTSIVNMLCQNDDCKQGHTNIQAMSDYVGGALSKITTLTAGKLLFGLDIEKLGQICSIIVVCLLFLYAIYFIITWTIRFTLFKQEGINIGAIICRATFPNIFLITKDQTKNSTSLDSTVQNI